MNDTSDSLPLPQAFAELGVRPSILRALAAEKFVTPSPIQELVIPRALEGGDLLGQARTGTGKTAAFSIPILQKAEKGTPTQALILVPTRELAMQVAHEIERLGQFTPIRSLAVYGGQKITAQMKFLKHNPEILVGTPGRVMDLLERRLIHFRNIRFVVLDEVDRMLDIGFRDDIRKILSRVEGMTQNRDEGTEARRHGGGNKDTASDAQHDEDEKVSHTAPSSLRAPAPSSLPQTIFVSATLSSEIERLARRYMQEPVEKLIAPGADEKPTVDNVEQYYFSVQPWDKPRLLKALLERENPDLAIVFCRTKRGAEKVARRLHAGGIECREIHGNLDQNKRERVMKNFRSGKFDVLIATDLASRGIDVADISHIINYDIPDDPEAYVHRIGRTARMGAAGKAFTFVQKDQGEQLTKVENLINMVLPQATLENFEPTDPPADWTDAKPTPEQRRNTPPAVSRFARPYGANTQGTTTLPPPRRTIGSKIPVNRRHKRRR